MIRPQVQVVGTHNCDAHTHLPPAHTFGFHGRRGRVSAGFVASDTMGAVRWCVEFFYC